MLSPTISDHHLSTIEDDLSDIVDIELLKYQLFSHRKRLTSLMESLMKAQFAYEHVVPRDQFDQLLEEKIQLEQNSNRLKGQYLRLSQVCLYLIQKTQDLIEERNEYYQDWHRHGETLTPRPDWDKVSNVIDGGRERWKSLATGRSSDELVEILIEEILDGNGNWSDQGDEFQGLGDDSTVLTFLRTSKETRLINRRMRRRITGLLIKEIWMNQIERTLTEKQPRSSISHSLSNENFTSASLADCVADYLEKRFDSKRIALEIGYNLRDACQRYRHCRQINLFWGILTGQVEELVYHHQRRSIAQLLEHFLRMITFYSSKNESNSPRNRKTMISELNSPSTLLNQQRLSSISTLKAIGSFDQSVEKASDLFFSNEEFLEALKLFYPKKTSSQLDALYHSARRDMLFIDDRISIGSIFIEDDQGDFGAFLSTLIDQVHQEKMIYVEKLKEILIGYPLINVVQFSRAVQMIDPQIDPKELNRYIEWVFQVNNAQSVETIRPRDFEDLLRRLENCACFQH